MIETRTARPFMMVLCISACLISVGPLLATDSSSTFGNENNGRVRRNIETGAAYYAVLPLAVGVVDRSLWSTHVAGSLNCPSRLSVRGGYELGGIVSGGSGHVFHHGPFLGGRYDVVQRGGRVASGLLVGADIRVRWISGFRRSPIVGVTASGGFPITIGGRVTMVNEVAGGWFFGDAAHLVIGIRNAIVLAF